MTKQVFSGVRVLDLTHHVAGPYCTKMLADYGAEVIKIEKPGQGDATRRMEPFFEDDPHHEKSGMFLYLNTNKKGITLNLKNRTGVDIFKKLVRDADVVVESFSPRVMPDLGLDYETLKEINPKLVMTSISSFGPTGPYRDFKATEIVESALGGWTWGMGDPDKPPLQAGGAHTQYVAGLYAAIGTLMALYWARLKGIGQQVHISVMEAVASILFYGDTVGYSYTGTTRTRAGNRWSALTPFLSIQPCKDGHIGFFCSTEDQWQSLCVLLEMVELLDDPRFQLGIDRVEHSEILEPIIQERLMNHNSEQLFHEAQELRIPFAMIANMEHVFNFAQLKDREFFVDIDHPVTGKLKYPGAPFKMSKTPWKVTNCAPLLGEHNEEILCGRLHYTREQLVMLRETSVI